MGLHQPKLNDAIDAAEAAFWEEILKHYPEVKTGNKNPLTDLFWPKGANRTPAIYLNLLKPTLDRVVAVAGTELSETDYTANDVFEDVCAAMQNAEEIGGPTGQRYLDLMKKIAGEANRRASNYTENVLKNGEA
jgi:hypothetical protein